MSTRAYVSFGSNLGERKNHILNALRYLKRTAGIDILRVSPVYENPAEGFTQPAPPFLNGVVEIDVNFSAAQLMDTLLRIETELGRVRPAGNGCQSRTIDLDLLLFGGTIIQTPSLTVPHPRITQRWFVLKPLSGLAPEFIIPGVEISVKQAFEQLGDSRPAAGIHIWTHP